MAKVHNSYGGFLVIAVLVWLFAGSELFQRGVIELHGTVVAAQTSCVQPQNSRCSTKYLVESKQQFYTTYVAGPTDKALQRQLPVGTVLSKDKWALAYSIDGQQINDFPTLFYSGLLVLGLRCVLLSYARFKSGS